MSCPSLSSRDKEGLQSKMAINAIQTDDYDEYADEDYDQNMMNQLAEMRGYNTGEKIHFSNNVTQKDTSIHVIKPIPSQILTVFQNNIPIHLDMDSGCWINSVRLEFANKMNWKLHPNGQLAKIADGKTVLKSKGEIHEVFQRNNWKVKFSAIVLQDLHTNVIAGNNFLLDNNVKQDIPNKTIIIHNKYTVPETNRYTELPTLPINAIMPLSKPTIHLPDQTIHIKVPHENQTVVLVEPAPGTKTGWPTPQLCTVKNHTVHVVNPTRQPISVKKQNISVKKTLVEADLPNIATTKYNVNLNIVQQNNIQDVVTNSERLNDQQKLRVNNMLTRQSSVFDQDLRQGYNQYSGPHFCKLQFATAERPSSKKATCVQYNSQMNTLLQRVCDELTEAEVLGIPQHNNIEVQHVMPCFLRRKQKAKDKPLNELTTTDVRLVVNTCELSKHMKSLPSKVQKPQDVYNKLARWKYIVKTDLYQGFFQNHLHRDAQKWCAILTPFGGLRYFKRGIQGLINQSEELDELLCNIFKDMLTDGKLIKQADDLFVGGEDIEEAINNVEELLEICKKNNLKLSPSKTVMFPRSVDIMSWIWSEGGTLAPSPHRKLALVKVAEEDLKTVRDLRSWIGLYKTFIYHTPSLCKVMDPFDKVVGDKDSSDEVIWTEEMKTALQFAKDHVANIKEVYLPHPDDQLIIITDGARVPPGVGFVLQARDKSGNIRTVRHYSVKLKQHHIKWSPCEIEAVAFGTAIEAFYDIVKESTKPVIICPDSKPVCDASKLLQKGKFSLSPRIQTFLNNMGKINCEVQHISGKSGQNISADFQSRNTEICKAEICQLCNYVNHESDTILDSKLGSIQQEIPFSNRLGWKNIQAQDKACCLAKTAMTSGQLISKKSGKVNSDARRIVSQGKLSSDGLITVQRSVEYSATKQERIVVPSSYLQALLTQMHYKHNHPAKSQLKSLFDKYFFGVGTNTIIDLLYDNCSLCNAMKKLPKQEIFSSTTNAQHPGTHFVCDILRRARQKIMVIRDQFSSYTLATFVHSESSEDLRDAIIDLITPIRVKGKVIIRTDKATGFQKIKANNQLEAANITIELGDDFNKNSNAVVDKAIQELEREITILKPNEHPIDRIILSKAVMTLNERLRRNGELSAWNILFSRDDKKDENIMLDDKIIASEQKKVRNDANTKKSATLNLPTSICNGDQVMLKDNPKKHNIRDTFLVTEQLEDRVKLQKLVNTSSKNVKLRNKGYLVPAHKVFKVQAKYTMPKSTPHTQKYKDFDPVRRDDSSDIESDDNSVVEDQVEERNIIPINVDLAEPVSIDINNSVDNMEIEEDILEHGLRYNVEDNLAHGPQDNLEEIDEDVIMNEIPDNIDELPDNIDEPSVPSPEGSTDPSPAVLYDNQKIMDMSGNIDMEINQDNYTQTKRKKDIWFTSKTRRRREIWFTPQKKRSHFITRRAVENLRRKIAALRIQKWYRKIKSAQNYERELITPEMNRDDPKEKSYLASSTPEARVLSCDEDDLDSNVARKDDEFEEEFNEESSCEWDSHETCIEMSDPFNEAIVATPLNLHFSFSESDLTRVYDFTNVLPVLSSPKALEPKKTKKRKYNTLKKSIARFIGNKRRGGTPSK